MSEINVTIEENNPINVTIDGATLVTLTGVTGPESSTDNALARFDSTTGKIIQNGTITEDDNGNLSNVLSAQFQATSAPTYVKGTLWYDNSTNALSYYDHISGTSIQIGKEEIVDVRNSTGSTITNGSVVYINGSTGQLPTVALADADNIGTSQIIGVATHDISNNSNGKITVGGLVNGIDTSAFSAGDTVYLSSTAGQMASTPPVSPSNVVEVGHIVTSNPTTGTLLVHTSEVISNNNSLGTSQLISATQNAVKTYIDTQIASNKALSVRTVTSGTTQTTNDEVIRCNSTSVLTINLLPASNWSGLILRIKSINTGAVTIDADGAETIDGVLTQTINQYDSITLFSNGTSIDII